MAPKSRAAYRRLYETRCHMQNESVATTKLWHILTLPQRRFITALESFEEPPTVMQIGQKLDRTRKAIEAVINQLVDAGLYSKERQGRSGGGRKANLLLRADLNDSRTLEAIANYLSQSNRRALRLQESNGQSKSGGNAIGNWIDVQSTPIAFDHLINANDTPPYSVCRGSVSDTRRAIFENCLGNAKKEPIVANDAVHLAPSIYSVCQVAAAPTAFYPFPNCFPVPAAYMTSDDGFFNDQLPIDDDPLSEDLADWYEAQYEVITENESFRVLSIDPGSLFVAYSLLGPGPLHIISGSEIVSGYKNIRLRAVSAGEIVSRWIGILQPTWIVLEHPNYLKEGISRKRFETFLMSYREIVKVINSSGLPYELVNASAIGLHSSNSTKIQMKNENLRFYQERVGRITNDHTADAFRLGWEYITHCGQQIADKFNYDQAYSLATSPSE